MTDRAFDPDNSNPFSQLRADKIDYEPADPIKTQEPQKPQGNPFESLNKTLDYPTDADDTSATGAFARGAARSALPALGSFPAIGAGATAGAAAGTAIFPGIGTVVGGIAGGVAAGFGASYAIDTAQNWALQKLPESFRESIGQSETQQQLDLKEHPTASFIGGLLPYLMTMKPGGLGKAADLPENATALQRIMANPATARVFGGAVMGGMELGQEAVSPNPVDWTKVAISTGFGVVFNRPTRIGETLTEWGAQPARRALGRPEPVSGATTPAAGETAPAEGPATVEAAPEATPARTTRYGVDLFVPHGEERPATVADANDLGTMGPGVTEETFQGSHQRAEDARLTASEMKRTEQAAIGPDPEVDIHHAARAMHPELFSEYDNLKTQQRQLENWIASNDEGESPHAVKHLEETNRQVSEIEPQIAAAYRRAAEAHGGLIHEEPEPAAGLGGYLFGGKDEAARGEQPTPKTAEAAVASPPTGELPAQQAAAPRTIEQQRDFIRGDVEKDLVAAGRPKEEAQAAAALIAARYEARAARFHGKLGTPEELYNAEHAEILGPGQRSEQARPWKPRAPAQRERISLLQFIAQRGGIKADDPLASDVRSTIGRDNKLIPGFGPLLRKTGIPLDRLREAAVEAGYLPPHSEQSPSTVRSLIDAIHDEEKGRTVHAQGEELSGKESGAERDDHLHAIEEELNQGLRDVSIDPNAIDDKVRSRAVEIMDKEHERDPVKAYEMAESELGLFQRDQSELEYAHGKDNEAQLLGIRIRQIVYDRALSRKQGIDVDGESYALVRQELAGLRARLKEITTARELEQAARGKIALLEGRRPIISLMKDANASTFIHETGHEWLEQMRRDAEHEAAPDSVKQDSATINKWLGIEPGTENIPTKAHEKFARGFEQYLREGIAPSPELASVFARFKQWLVQIYQSLKGLGQPINDDIKQVFDRMLSAEPQRTVIAPERAQRPTLSDIHNADAAEASPHEADPVADRIYAEKSHYIDNIPEDIAREHEAALEETARLEAEGFQPGQEQPGGAAVDAAGEARPGGDGRAEVVGAGAEPDAEPTGGAGGAEHGAVQPGRAEPPRESAPVRGAGERPGGGEESQSVPLAATPAANFSVGGESFNIGKDGNIRTENITSVPQFIKAIEESKERIGGSGPATIGQMLDTAEAIGMDPKDFDEARLGQLFGGIKDLGPKIAALRFAVETQARTVSELSKQFAKTGSNDALLAFATESSRLDMMASVLSSTTTEWGRAGAAFRNLENLQKAKDIHEITKGLQENTGRALFQLKAAAKLISTLDTPAKVARVLRDAQARSGGRMLVEYYINALISGLATHMTYLDGNLILSVMKAGPETAAAAMVGRVRQAMGRPGERVLAGEVGAQFKAMFEGLPAATQSAIEASKTGLTTLLPEEKARPLSPYAGDTGLVTAKTTTNAPVTWVEVGGDLFGLARSIRDGFHSTRELIAAGGDIDAPVVGASYSPLGQIPDIAYRGVPVVPVGSLIRAPGRMIAAIHSFFRTSSYIREVAGMAFRQASGELEAGTLAPADFAARVAEIRNRPSPEQMELARNSATEIALMSQGGKFMHALSQLTNASITVPGLGELPMLKFIDPFVHISGNIIKEAALKRTPLGIFSAEIRADMMGRNGNIAQDTAIGRMLVGTSLAVLYGTLKAQGYITGSEPSDPNEAQQWREVYQAHSVRIGDLWYQTNRLGPMGMHMGIAADLYDVAHEASQGDMTKAGSHLLHAITQNVFDESFAKGPSDLMKAIEDPARYGESYVRNFVSSFVPFSVGLAQMERASDPYSRQARTVMDAIKAKIPGLASTLLPRRNVWGDEIPNLPAFEGRAISAILEKRANSDPVNQAMLDLGVHPAMPERKIRNVDLTDQQYDDYARIAGRMAKIRLDTIVKSPDYRSWPNHVKAAVIQETIRQSRESARGMMLMKFPQIVQDATEARKKKFQD